MFPTTPTLPTVIVTPCTPLHLLPTRSTYQFSSSSSSSSSSGSRHSSRKQHLMSALELGPSLFPHPGPTEEKPDYSLLLPSSFDRAQRRRNANGILSSMLVLGVFALVLVGPMLPYRWYAGLNGAELELSALGSADAATPATISIIPDVGGQQEGEAVLLGARSAVFKRGIEEIVIQAEEQPSWRSTVLHGLEWALLD